MVKDYYELNCLVSTEEIDEWYYIKLSATYPLSHKEIMRRALSHIRSEHGKKAKITDVKIKGTI